MISASGFTDVIASHAGGAPQLGINALSAAMLALNAIHAQRETFWDKDTIRIHPIITKGGDAVSVVPAEVHMETFVRGGSRDAIIDANMKVDRCLRAGAMAMGAEVEINTIPGYLPQRNDRGMGEPVRVSSRESRVLSRGKCEALCASPGPVARDQRE